MSRTANNLPKNKKCVYIISQNTRGLKSDEKYKNYVQKLKVEIFFQLAFKKLGELVSVHLNIRTVLSLVTD